MSSARLSVGIAVTLALLPSIAVTDPGSAACALLREGSEQMTVDQCQACHRHRGHPVGIDHDRAQRRGWTDLRSANEAVRRGVFLPSGEIRCVTCHDRRSPWADHLALPAGAQARRALDVGDPATYDPEHPDYADRNAAPAAGAPVSPTPLCKACHVRD